MSAALMVIGAAIWTAAAVATAAIRVVLVFVLELLKHLLANLSHDGAAGQRSECTHMSPCHLVASPASSSAGRHRANATFARDGIAMLIVLHRLLLLLLIVAVRLLVMLLLTIKRRRWGPIAGRVGCTVSAALSATIMLWLGSWAAIGAVRRLRCPCETLLRSAVIR